MTTTTQTTTQTTTKRALDVTTTKPTSKVGKALKTAGKILRNAGKPSKSKLSKSAKPSTPAAPKAANANLMSTFAVNFASAFKAAAKAAKLAGKPHASIAVNTADVVKAGVSLQALNKMAHVGAVKWSDKPSLDAKALDAGKVKLTAHGAARYDAAFKAAK